MPFGIDRSPVESSGVRWTPVDSDGNKRGRVKSSVEVRKAEAGGRTKSCGVCMSG